jgi:hypothetical protein
VSTALVSCSPDAHLNVELTLERVPLLPELWHDSWVAELTGVGIDRSGSIDLSELPLHLGETSAHLGRLLVWQLLQRSLVDWSRGGQSKVGGGFGDIDSEHLKLIRVLHGRGGSVVNAHSALGETMIFFQLGVHEEEGLAELLWTILEGLFEQVSSSLKLLAAVSLDEFGQVDVPDLEGNGEVEQLNTTFVNLAVSLFIDS